jgi:hypothetical protein
MEVIRDGGRHLAILFPASRIGDCGFGDELVQYVLHDGGRLALDETGGDFRTRVVWYSSRHFGVAIVEDIDHGGLERVVCFGDDVDGPEQGFTQFIVQRIRELHGNALAGELERKLAQGA